MKFLRSAVAAMAVGATLGLSACETAPVTGRKQLILLSEDQAQEMGLQAYKQILQEKKISHNSAQQQRIRRVGQRIAAVSGRPNLPWEFTLIENEEPNAFALPGGKVGVNTGLFKVVQTDDQLAAVMAHEVAHAIARHSAERISQQVALKAGLTGISMAGPEAQKWTKLAATAATLGIVLPYSRKQESEADHIGLTYMARAGYDPRAAIDLWRNFEAVGGSRPPQFLSTHPSPGNRIAQIQQLLPQVMPIYRANR